MIILFTGLSAVGKTTIAKQLGQELDVPVVSTREVVHNLANINGFERSRHWLKAVGLKQFQDLSLVALLEEVKASASSKGVILDDAFDPRLQFLLRWDFGDKLVTIAVHTEDNLRLERIVKRLNAGISEAKRELEFLDFFKREAGIEEVIRLADISFVNEGTPLNEIVLQIREGVEARNFGARETFLKSKPGGTER